MSEAKIRRFRKLPVEIEAAQYTGNNAALILFWVGSEVGREGRPLRNPEREREAFVDDAGALRLRTLESGGGTHVVDVGDWVIHGIAGEFYPCKPEIFAATYEAVDAKPQP